MLKNFLKITWRNLIRNKVFSFINVLGLALGMVCVLFILLWVWDEVSFNRFHEKGDRLYRVISEVQWDGTQIWTTTPARLADVLRREIPEIENSVKTTHERDLLIEINGERGKEKGMHAGPEFLTLFTFPLLQGNAETALGGPDQIVISRGFAERYFGGEDPMGKTVRVDNSEEYRVTAVMENVPFNSSLQFDILLPQASFERGKDWVELWGVFSFYTYVLLHEGADQETVNRKIADVISEHTDVDSSHRLFLEPLPDIYLYNNYSNGRQEGGRILYVYLFSAIALFILLLGCINFMNLATARSVQRAKEVGIRKTSGAGRFDLAAQFIGEALVMSVISMGAAVLLFELLLPHFNTLTGKHLEISLLHPSLIFILLVIVLITGFVAGSYPAFFLSSLKPVHTLKGVMAPGSGHAQLRKALVVFQFTLTITLMIATAIVYHQVQYVQTKHPGYDREHLMLSPLYGDLYGNRDTFKEVLLQSPAIQSATFVGDYPHNISGSSGDLSWDGKPAGQTVDVTPFSVGYDFLETMKIELKEGRDFSPEFSTDNTAYIINETAARLMGMDEPVGQEIEFWLGRGPVIGVVEDFHFTSMHEPIKPLILMALPDNAEGILVRTQAGQTREAIGALTKVAGELNPAYPLEYFFLDDLYDQLYRSEQLVDTFARIATLFVIVISCLGLFGLTLFMVEQRTKEIGIRKVLGASVTGIVSLLSKDFLKLVLIGFVIAIPISWFAMNRWLEDFAYRIEIGPGVFLLAGLAAIVIALATLSWQSVKAAVMNPVKSLRSE